MDMDENLPRRADDPIAALQRQDLDPFSVEELRERVTALEAEISRTRKKIEYAVNHKASAEALFRRSEEHTSELKSLMRTSYALFCLKKTQTTSTFTTVPPHTAST